MARESCGTAMAPLNLILCKSFILKHVVKDSFSFSASCSEFVFVIVGAGWKTTTKPGWRTTSPLWPSWWPWCSQALWCSTSFSGRFATGRNGGRTAWLSSACGALAASSAQPGFWPSSTLDRSRSSLTSYFASSTLFKVCTCWTPPHHTVVYFYNCYQACSRCIMSD